MKTYGVWLTGLVVGFIAAILSIPSWPAVYALILNASFHLQATALYAAIGVAFVVSLASGVFGGIIAPYFVPKESGGSVSYWARFYGCILGAAIGSGIGFPIGTTIDAAMLFNSLALVYLAIVAGGLAAWLGARLAVRHHAPVETTRAEDA
jgi:hypothetical protein